MGRPAKSIKLPILYDILENNFSKFNDPRSGMAEISLPDILKSSFAVFAFKYPSLLSFEKAYNTEERFYKNMKKLFKLERIPSDTHLRDVLDDIDPNQFRKIFTEVFSHFQRSKHLEKYEFLNINGQPHYLLSCDGSGYFSSKKVRCQSCMTFNEDDNEKETRFGHYIMAGSIVHPLQKEVIPLCPEPITKKDGKMKNDSEQAAFHRFFGDFSREHCKLKTIVLLDALYANNPVVRGIKKKEQSFIIAIKPTKSTIFTRFNQLKSENEIETLEKVSHKGQKIIKEVTKYYQFVNGINLTQAKTSESVNFVNYRESINWIDKDGNPKSEIKKFSFITNIIITNNNVEDIVQGGRTKWKIENETFNTLKNQGYNLEHNYGHGKKYLSINLITMMFISFLFDQVQQSSCGQYKKALARSGTKRNFWSRIYSCFEWNFLETWEQFFELMVGASPDTG